MNAKSSSFLTAPFIVSVPGNAAAIGTVIDCGRLLSGIGSVNKGPSSMSSGSSSNARQNEIDLALIEFAGKRQIDGEWLAAFLLLLTVLAEGDE